MTSIYFKGNAPETGSRVLHNDNQARVYYNEGTTGWTNPWCDRPTYLYGTILEGDEFTDKGLRYTVLTSNLDKKVGTVSVRDDNVTGHLVIPATVAYNDYTLTVTQIPDEAFRGRSLTSVVIPDTVTSIGYLAFEYNPSLSELTIGNSVTTIGGHAFQNCMELGMVVIPASVTTLGDNAFEGCNSLASVYFEGDAPTAGSNVFLSANRSVIYYGSGTTGWTDPWCDRPAVEIDGVLITDQPQSQTVNVGSTVNFSVTAGGFGALSYQWYKDGSAIAGATSSRYTINNAKASDAGSYTVEVSSADKSVPSDEAVLEVLANSVGDVVTVDNVRYTILTEDTVKISGFESSIGSDIVIEGAIVLGDQSYSVVEIGNRAFNNCQNLQHVVINDGVTKIADQAFFYCRNLLTVEMPDSVVYIGGDGFYGCSSLVSAPLPNYITYLGDAMFGSCTSLQEIIIPATVSEIRAGFAGDCRSLTNLVIGENVTTIAWNAFNDCSSLTTVTIPEKVNFIGLTSFIRCTSLETVEILGSVTTVREQAFAFCPNLEGIYFAGDAPTRYYDNTLEGTDMVTIYYNEGTSGWTNPWYGRPAIVNHGDGLKFTWATPAPIYAGTPLGAEQLNATVNVPGMFTYNPGFGTILDAGTYVLNAAFTPKDGNYKSVSGAVMLEVLPLGLAYTYNANGTATVSGIGTLSEETEIEIPETGKMMLC